MVALKIWNTTNEISVFQFKWIAGYLLISLRILAAMLHSVDSVSNQWISSVILSPSFLKNAIKWVFDLLTRFGNFSRQRCGHQHAKAADARSFRSPYTCALDFDTCGFTPKERKKIIILRKGILPCKLRSARVYRRSNLRSKNKTSNSVKPVSGCWSVQRMKLSIREYPVESFTSANRAALAKFFDQSQPIYPPSR